ncbi:ABC transporter substrate-binding protein [Halocella sp. SP3-1]|uniref:ABC transporter substrate-binding protein n=1 Tax=Halocella sp. SP3-1 TaxID=2382161 RepID=UPI000F751831|nr:ABC transporter substrate-binding protein [Halocella sp. SP3-1]AZO95996.1 ABC transporter substrate-binding protein [Halocella sp. SP3-1]
MAKVLVHCPLNISRTMGEMLKGFIRQLNKKYGMDVRVEIQPHRPTEEHLFEKYVKEGNIPDLTIGHANDFAELSDDIMKEYFQPFSDLFPLRKELLDLKFTDPAGYFHTFALVPYAIIYNHKILKKEEAPCIWENLLEPQWEGRILLPDEFRTVSVIINSYMKTRFPQRYDDYRANTVFEGNPVDVVSAVDQGQYPVGIVNISFSRFSREKNVSSKWPDDGTFCVPQIMVWKKGIDERLLELGEYIMSEEMQKFFAQQSFIPAAPEILLPQEAENNECRLIWEGWGHFLKIISGDILTETGD